MGSADHEPPSLHGEVIRSITSALPPLGDVAAATRAVLDAVAGFGPLQPLLDDPTVDDFRVVR